MATAGTTAGRVGSPRRVAARRPASRPGVRWDRLGRVTLLVVLAGVLALYVRPAISYVQTWRESQAKRAELHRLTAEHKRLLARRRALVEPRSLEREARKLGMVRQDERAFVIQDLGAPPG